MAIELERLVRSGDTRIRQVDSANYSDYVAEAAIASTTGIRASYARTGAYVSVEAIANDGGDDQTGWGLSAGTRPRRARHREGRGRRDSSRDADAGRGEAEVVQVHGGLRSAHRGDAVLDHRRRLERRGRRARSIVLREPNR